MTNRQAKQAIIDEVSRINGFKTLWEPTFESVLAVKLGVKTATQAAKFELDEYTTMCSKAFKKHQ